MRFEESNNAETVREIVRAQIAKGNADKLRSALDTVVENIYRTLPSGDYGRGDVRRAILSILDA
jgi:hypothetical protein